MSAPRDDSVYLQHIRDAISRIESYLEGVSERKFLKTPLIQDAVIRQIQVIGEPPSAFLRSSARGRQRFRGQTSLACAISWFTTIWA